MFILLASSFVGVKATTSPTLPGFLENILEALHPNATPDQLNQIRIQWANQLAINQAHAPGSSNALSPMIGGYDGSWLVPNVWPEKENGGQVIGNTNNAAYWADNTCVELYTPNIGDRASIGGMMSSTNAGGNIYAHFAANTYHSGNYLMAWGSNDPNAPPDQWGFLGYVQCTSQSYYWGYIGYSAYSYHYMGFGDWAAGGSDPYNDIYLDCVWTSRY